MRFLWWLLAFVVFPFLLGVCLALCGCSPAQAAQTKPEHTGPGYRVVLMCRWPIPLPAALANPKKTVFMIPPDPREVAASAK